jgi:hypothetical protein
LNKRYNKLQNWKSNVVAELRRNFEHHTEFGRWEAWRQDRWGALTEEAQLVSKAWNLKYGKDIHVAILAIEANLMFAHTKGNRFLLREPLHGFPCMSYVTAEGPKLFDSYEQFGLEDYHCILQGDGGQLFYFEPEKYGLDQAYFIEQVGRP